MRQTKMANLNGDKKWYLVDATDLILGRMSTEVARIISGKNKPTYTPHEDCGDYVIIINSSKIKLTGDKLNKKFYYNHSGYPGGMRKRSAKTMINSYPNEMVYRAIWGMTPHNRLGRKIIKKLFIYPDAQHKHDAQKPKVLDLKKKVNK